MAKQRKAEVTKGMLMVDDLIAKADKVRKKSAKTIVRLQATRRELRERGR